MKNRTGDCYLVAPVEIQPATGKLRQSPGAYVWRCRRAVQQSCRIPPHAFRGAQLCGCCARIFGNLQVRRYLCTPGQQA